MFRSEKEDIELKRLFPIAVRLIHYIGIEDCDYIYEVNHQFNTPIDTILDTRWGSTFNTIKFLLNLPDNSTIVDNLDQPDMGYAYRVELIGYNLGGNIGISHTFLLVNIDEWMIIDSHFPNRALTIDSIDISELNALLKDTSVKFTLKTWYDITGYNITDSDIDKYYNDYNTYRVVVSIDAFKSNVDDIDPVKIDARFKELVRLALEHLKTDTGRSDEYIAILGLPVVDVDTTKEYLESLL